MQDKFTLHLPPTLRLLNKYTNKHLIYYKKCVSYSPLPIGILSLLGQYKALDLLKYKARYSFPIRYATDPPPVRWLANYSPSTEIQTLVASHRRGGGVFFGVRVGRNIAIAARGESTCWSGDTETKRYSQQRLDSVTEKNTILSQHRASPAVLHSSTQPPTPTALLHRPHTNFNLISPKSQKKCRSVFFFLPSSGNDVI